jgi:hypothetical protein
MDDTLREDGSYRTLIRLTRPIDMSGVVGRISLEITDSWRPLGFGNERALQHRTNDANGGSILKTGQGVEIRLAPFFCPPGQTEFV